MTDEEYERIKADEKEHLRKMKALREKTRRLQRAKKNAAAAEEGLRRAQDKLDESSDLARRLSADAARSEARLDLALGNDSGAKDEPPSAPRSRARDLVRRLRAEMAEEQTSAERGDDSGDDSSSDRPGKTIGPAT